ncbi:HD domain-containing protein [Shewanella sp. D64]|uniref:HD-GYP domain-containing protein n=1 Tax=unclassified Shewanella TaxID=196818 RepID=UPI0022BA4B14|nr:MULTISPECIES: HD domain-containing phosphohydrolase [unclassified Shewanella]MEC4725812.1 HD domain-containing protein [Shewanella sp. D64]MEC4737581.1 HD domain-containing protein [Shewanella sp. E94]WBJ93399.1 HD domain-containing protein [Shewanella sp. MTB7]
MARAEQVHLPLAKLQIGLTIKLPISWKNHPFLFNRIQIKEEIQIELIKSLGIPYVILLAGQELLTEEVEVSSEKLPEVEKVAPQVDVKLQVRKSLRVSQQRFIKSVNDCRSAFSKTGSDPEGAYRCSAALVEEMLEHMSEVELPELALVSAGESDSSITQHGISVAVVALMIAKAMKLNMSDMKDIALGCLYHDIGKLKVPDNIRRKKVALTDHEANFMKMHPNFGYDMISKSGLFPEKVLHIILHHHEFMDGSGYPDGLKGKKIPLTTQIVSLANDFDRQLWAETVRSPQVALGYLFKNRAGKHDEALMSCLVQILGIYPPGTIVQLSDKSIGKVMMTTKEVKQPHVWACEPDGSESSLRFLMQEKVSVEQVLKVEELSEGAIKALQPEMGISFYFNGVAGES